MNPANSDPRKFAADTANSVSLDETYIFSTQWTYHFDNADLKYIGGYDNYHYTLIADQDGGAIQGFTLPVAPFFRAGRRDRRAAHALLGRRRAAPASPSGRATPRPIRRTSTGSATS